jgi:hypothetical protein
VFAGSLANQALNGPVVGIAGTPSGQGYWLTAGDGGVFAFGDAGFFGSAVVLPITRTEHVPQQQPPEKPSPDPNAGQLAYTAWRDRNGAYLDYYADIPNPVFWSNERAIIVEVRAPYGHTVSIEHLDNRNRDPGVVILAPGQATGFFNGLEVEGKWLLIPLDYEGLLAAAPMSLGFLVSWRAP